MVTDNVHTAQEKKKKKTSKTKNDKDVGMVLSHL